MAKRIGIVGSRRRDSLCDMRILCDAFNEIFEEGDSIVSGGCTKGGDRFAESIARDLGLTIVIHFPDWKKHGKAAGFVRNSMIAENCDVLLALVAMDRTGGTEDTVRKAEKLAKKVVLV